MKSNLKRLGRRGLAFLLALMMCVSIPRFPVYAEESDNANGIQAFLDAVNAIEVPEEDLALEENAGLAQTLGEAIGYASQLYEGLSKEKQELQEVNTAYMELNNMAAVLSGGIETLDAYGSGGISVTPDYDPNGCVPGVSKFGGSVTKQMGESGFYKRRAVHNFFCPTCGWFFGQSTAKEYANIQWQPDKEGVISDVSFQAGVLEGYPCLEMDFTGRQAGTTLVTLQYDVNFHTRWNAGYAACPSCGTGTSVQQYDNNWYHYVDQFYVTVVDPDARDDANTHYFFVPANGDEYDSLTYEMTNIEPYNGGFWWCSVGENSYQKKEKPTVAYEAAANEYVEVEQKRGVDNFKDGYYTGWMIRIKGKRATPNGMPVIVKIKYHDSVCKRMKTDTLKIVVYDPDTITLKQGETVSFDYKEDVSGNYSAGREIKSLITSDNSISCTTDNNNKYTITADTWSGITIPAKDSKSVTISVKATEPGKYTNTAEVFVVGDEGNLQRDTANVEVKENTPETVDAQVIKKFVGIDKIPEDFELSYTVDDEKMTLTKDNAFSKDDTTLKWEISIPKGTKLSFEEKNAGITGKKLTVTVIGALAESVTVEGEEFVPSSTAGHVTDSDTDSDTDSVDDDFWDNLFGASGSGFVSGSASTTVTVMPSITITNTYEETPDNPDPDPVKPEGKLEIIKKVNGNGSTSENTPENAEKKDDETYTGEYEVTVTNKTNVTLGAMKIVDDMDSNLKLNEVISVKIGSKEVEKANFAESGSKLTWTIEGVEIEPGEKVTITYTATMPAGETALKNTVRAKAKQAKAQEEQAMFKARAISDNDFGDDWGFDSGEAEAWIKPGTGTGGGDNPTPGGDDDTAFYTVRWIDAADDSQIKSETRGPEKIGTKVSVSEANKDKVIEGYTFDEENKGNKLEATLEKSGTELILYFTKNQEQGKTYSVTYQWNLPEGASETLPTEPNHKEGESVAVDKTYSKGAETVVRSGENTKTYVFSGWSSDDADIMDGTFNMPGKNVIIKGTWTEKPDVPTDPDDPAKTYSVTYQWNLPKGASEDEKLPTEPDHAKGEKVTVDTTYPSGKEITVSTEEGTKTYVFSGWSSSDVTITGRTFEMPGKDVVITGVWKEKDGGTTEPDPVTLTDYKFRIVYYHNDEKGDDEGRFTTGPKTASTASNATREDLMELADDLKLFELMEDGPGRKGFEFLGWTFVRDDEMTGVEEDDRLWSIGNGFNAVRKVGEQSYELSLYALWEKVEPVTPTDPTDPSTPENPTDPATPEDPTNPTDPSTPEDPTNPTDPSTPENPTGPTDPSTPENPTNPTDPATPEDPTNPTDPSTPENPTGPTDPTAPEDPTNPTDPATPENPTTPTEPTTPSGGYNRDSGGSGGSRRTGDSNSGPGTLQINEPEVPLAGLPESVENQLTRINDDDVPLAGLPKTGEGTSPAKMMLFLSGIMLAAYASLSRKEEEK